MVRLATRSTSAYCMRERVTAPRTTPITRREPTGEANGRPTFVRPTNWIVPHQDSPTPFEECAHFPQKLQGFEPHRQRAPCWTQQVRADGVSSADRATDRSHGRIIDRAGTISLMLAQSPRAKHSPIITTRANRDKPNSHVTKGHLRLSALRDRADFKESAVSDQLRDAIWPSKQGSVSENTDRIFPKPLQD